MPTEQHLSQFAPFVGHPERTETSIISKEMLSKACRLMGILVKRLESFAIDYTSVRPSYVHLFHHRYAAVVI